MGEENRQCQRSGAWQKARWRGEKGDFLTKSCQMASVLCTGLTVSCKRIRLCSRITDTARYNAACMTRYSAEIYFIRMRRKRPVKHFHASQL